MRSDDLHIEAGRHRRLIHRRLAVDVLGLVHERSASPRYSSWPATWRGVASRS